MATPRKQSLFALRMQNSKKLKLEEKKISEKNHIDPQCFGNKSCIVSGPDAEIIHQENCKKLSEMSPEELLEEKKKLLSNLDPSLIDFLKSRKLANISESETVSRLHGSATSTAYCSDTQSKDNGLGEGHKVAPSSEDVTSSSLDPRVSQVPAGDLVNKYPHMDVVELDKLEWMQDLPQAHPPTTGIPYNARFDFNGELLPYTQAQQIDGLHHHGEEPHRPGYTLQELMQLSRSSVQQQRVTAISTLANICNKASDYDYCLTQPLLPQLLQSELYLLLRFTLDDPARPLVTAAVAAIANLLVNIKDEGCLDRLLGSNTGLRQPLLYVHLDLKPSELSELKDTELIKVDVIRGAIRTHLLTRFRYILENLFPEPAETAHIMRCLIRIARHSVEAANAIIKEPGLMKSIHQRLSERPPQACSDALKLFRVIACHSHSLAEQVLHTHTLMDVIQHFIAGDREEISMSLVLESFYTWQTFLFYNLGTQSISAFSPVIGRLLMWHAESVGLESRGGDLEHATSLVSWLVCALRCDPSVVRCCLSPMRLCALKWLSQAAHVSHLKWAARKLLEATLTVMASLITLQDSKDLEIQYKVEVFLDSKIFCSLSQNIRKSSWLLEGESHPSTMECLPCLGPVPPTLYDSSPLPVITGLVLYMYAVQCPQLSEKLVTSEGVLRYLEEVVTAGVRSTMSHWFARQEIMFINTLLHLNTYAVESSLLHRAALFLSTSIHSDDRYILTHLFDQFIFKKSFFSLDIREVTSQMQELQISPNCGLTCENRSKLLQDSLDSLETIKVCYQRELSLLRLTAATPPLTLTASSRGTEPALPADWHLLPLVHLNNIDGKRGDATKVAVSCLQWSLVLECLRPRFVANLSAASRFCRLACVLLAGSELFCETREWLRENLQELLKYNNQMNFEKPIPGLQSFYDFYRQILEQFVGVSYGDPVFGQFVLIPLQQRHSVRFKKLIWCELGTVLRFLSTPVHQIGVPLENFLEPCETDLELLLIYLKALGQGVVRDNFCPVLYRVAVHHVATFIRHHPDMPAAQRLHQLISSLGNQVLKNLLLNYSNSSVQ